MDIHGKKVVITGGARGLGRAYALDLKAHGAQPYVVDLVKEGLESLERESGIPGRILDVTDVPGVVAFMEEYARENGPPDVLINNAGITADQLFLKKQDGEVVKFSLEGWDRVMNVNLKGTFVFAREAAYHMVKGGKPGVIINISSISRAGNFGQTNYSATKAAVVTMTVTWTKELSRYGIRVAAIAPGYVKTEMSAAVKPEVQEKILQRIPLGRMGEKHEIAHAVRFIIENDYFTGRVLEVDGGMRL